MSLAWLAAAIIQAAAAGGVEVPMTAAAGDGCNTCSWTRYWTLEEEAGRLEGNDSWMMCTLMACYVGPDAIVELELGDLRPPEPEPPSGRCCTVGFTREDGEYVCADPGGERDCELEPLEAGDILSTLDFADFTVTDVWGSGDGGIITIADPCDPWNGTEDQSAKRGHVVWVLSDELDDTQADAPGACCHPLDSSPGCGTDALCSPGWVQVWEPLCP